MKQYFTDERTGISYTLQGDYYLPDLAYPPKNKSKSHLGTAALAVYQGAPQRFLYDLAHKMRTEQTPCRCK